MSEVRTLSDKRDPPDYSRMNDDEFIAQIAKDEADRRTRSQFDDWERPTEFSVSELPPFPVDVLPTVLADFVRAESEFSQTPPDVAAMLSLTACAAAIGKGAVCEVKPGYREPLNLFCAVVLPPGERKSAVMGAVMAPFESWEKKERERLKTQIAYSVMKKQMIEKQIENQMRVFVKAKGQNQRDAAEAELQQLNQNLEQHKLVLPPRVLCDDATPEALVSLLAQNEGRAAQFSAEGGVFSMLGGRYSDKVSFDAYLKGHAGECIRVDRKGRASEFVDAPALTVGLAVQPAVIEELGDNRQFRGVGLLARFLYSFPKSRMGLRLVETTPVPENIRASYAQTIERMLTLPRAFGGQQMVLKMDPVARKLFFEFSSWIEPQLAEFEAFESIRDWAAKLAGAVARIAAILSILRILGFLALDRVLDFSSIYIGIESEAMASAIAIGKYLVQHALAAFSTMGFDERTGDAMVLLRSIKKRELTEFTHRDIQQHLKHSDRFSRVEKLDTALSVLVERGFIRRVEIERKQGPGRPPGPSFEVNPFLFLAAKILFTPKMDGSP